MLVYIDLLSQSFVMAYQNKVNTKGSGALTMLGTMHE